MSGSLRFLLFTILLITVFFTWRATVSHLYNPTVRTPLPLPRTTYTPTATELSIRFMGNEP